MKLKQVNIHWKVLNMPDILYERNWRKAKDSRQNENFLSEKIKVYEFL